MEKPSIGPGKGGRGDVQLRALLKLAEQQNPDLVRSETAKLKGGVSPHNGIDQAQTSGNNDQRSFDFKAFISNPKNILIGLGCAIPTCCVGTGAVGAAIYFLSQMAR